MSVKSVVAKIKLANLGLNLISNSSFSLCCNRTEDSNITSNPNQTYHTALIEKWFPQHFDKLQGNTTCINTVIVFAYSVIIVVSLFGNLIVCKIVFGKSGTKSTANFYIGNLSISDLMMTVINIPLQLTKILVRNWPLGFVLCKCLPFFGAISVNVSTLTMAFIALDRYKVIAYPLKPRPKLSTTIHKLIFIWIMAFILSFPFFLMSHTDSHLSYEYITRCVISYPSPKFLSRQIFTLIALLLQFVGPLIICAITYLKICLIIWKRRSIGTVTQSQQIHQLEAKWKTIKMLILVLIVFVVCWLPLQIYHTYQDARGETDFKKHKSTVWLTCHWFAMSSVCFNPFIYCWLNEKFRNKSKAYFKWFLTTRKIQSQIVALHFLPGNTSQTVVRNTSASFPTFSCQSKEFPSWKLQEI